MKCGPLKVDLRKAGLKCTAAGPCQGFWLVVSGTWVVLGCASIVSLFDELQLHYVKPHLQHDVLHRLTIGKQLAIFPRPRPVLQLSARCAHAARAFEESIFFQNKVSTEWTE